MGKEGSNDQVNTTAEVSVVNISSISDNLICRGSKHRENMGNVFGENDNETMKSMGMEKACSGNCVNGEIYGIIYMKNTNNNHNKSIQQNKCATRDK